MKKFTFLFLIIALLSSGAAIAQKKIITGVITNQQDGKPVIGATISVKGTTVATLSDAEGKYQLTVSDKDKTLEVTFIGMKTQEITIGTSDVINVVLQPEIFKMNELVVTALGVTREKKSLGYSTQQVSGSDVTVVQTDNFINNLSGKVSGLDITTNTNMGGSTNVVIRGNKSIMGNNQALFVIDGVPIDNTNTNTGTQRQGENGYDYGNAASDINPDDIESINVLKGAAATALYGSRAANGVIMITTKKGAGAPGEPAKKGIGVELGSSFDIGFVDKSTFPEYQKDYGAGYGAYWLTGSLNGKTYYPIAPTTDDASCGYRFNPNQLVYQWNAFYPGSPEYGEATPWVAAKNGPITFFNDPTTFTNSFAVSNNTDQGSYRLAYTKYKENGLMPNSDLQKDNVLMNGVWKVTDKLTASASGNFNLTNALGRNSTGYYDGITTSFRQWMETNVDIKQQKDAYFSSKQNYTWNWADPTDISQGPAYWDNYYWTRYQNYETDSRDRYIGYLTLDYKVADWVDIFGRASGDTYNAIEEERRAVGSVPTTFGLGNGPDDSYNRPLIGSGYLRRDYTFSEFNYDLMANFKKDLTKDFSLTGILGTNIRRTIYNQMANSTNGGLVVPDLYALSNSAGPLPLPYENNSTIGVDGMYANVSLGYKSMLYLDGSVRRDVSSTLPVGNNAYVYPSIAGSFVFSNLLQDYKWLSFSKVHLNYAEVGNSAPFAQLVDTYIASTPFNSPIYAASYTKNNSGLMPERTNSGEAGIEADFLDRRAGFDFTAYNANSVNQIIPLTVTPATGYEYKNINAGKIQNKGLELSMHGTPIKINDFKWDINVNWAMNRNKLVSLAPGVDDLQLGSFQGGVTIDARVGQPYGVIEGTDYVYLNGKRVIDPSTGNYEITQNSNNVIGNPNPKWTGGVGNTFTYKNWSLFFLIDVRHGGDIWSLDMSYGLATGIYKETSYLNDLGNPVRDPVVWKDPNDHSKGYASNSGGIILKGVNPNGQTNTTREECDPDNNGGLTPFGYYNNPDKAFVYDGSFVKLREIAVNYKFPPLLLKKYFITGVIVGLYGRNVRIIHKNLPYADPESGLSSGNLQGYTTSSLPSTRNFGVNVKLNF